MLTEYFPETDTITFALKNEKIIESDEVHPNLLVDYGTNEEILQLDIRCAKILYNFTDKYEEKVVENKKIIKFANDKNIERSSTLKTDDPRIDIMLCEEKWTAIVIKKFF